jgi:hypothetical protein
MGFHLFSDGRHRDGKASVNPDRLRSVVTHPVINLNKIIATTIPPRRHDPMQEARRLV